LQAAIIFSRIAAGGQNSVGFLKMRHRFKGSYHPNVVSIDFPERALRMPGRSIKAISDCQPFCLSLLFKTIISAINQNSNMNKMNMISLFSL
jgi:hypothetical protein